jgi:hypothetical protein
MLPSSQCNALYLNFARGRWSPLSFNLLYGAHSLHAVLFSSSVATQFRNSIRKAIIMPYIAISN